MKKTFALATLVAFFGPGCALASDPSDESNVFDTPPAMSSQGVAMNGPVLQGTRLNGVVLNGVTLNGIAFNGANLAGASLSGSLELVGGELIARLNGGETLRGDDLVGTTLQGLLSNGSSVGLRIEQIDATTNNQIFAYTVTYQSDNEWKPLCGLDGNDEPIKALAAAGRWDESHGTSTGGDHLDDPTLFTFACRNAAVAKCIDAGYMPWRQIYECKQRNCHWISMRTMHQACTRMLRADYCGDGTPHTVNGTLINQWDNFNIQQRDTELNVSWTNEAEWSANGAVCVNQVRWSGTAEAYIAEHCSERLATNGNCLSGSSTFFTANGYSTPATERSFFMNQFTHDSP